MITFTFPENDVGELLLQEELEISEKDFRIQRSKTQEQGKEEGDISLLLTRKNRVAVRKPKSENLVAYLLEQKQDISPHIEKDIKAGYDFFHVAIICSFLPDPTCKFTWARLTVKMQFAPKEDDLLVQGKPLVCDLFPIEINSEVRMQRTFKISGGLSYEFIEFKPESETKSEFIIYQPEIFAVGREGSTFSWDFKESVQKSIYGDKVLFAIIKKPKDSQVVGQFEIDAQVKIKEGFIGIPPFVKRKKDAVNILYEIC